MSSQKLKLIHKENLIPVAQFTPRIQELIAEGKVKVYNSLKEFYDRKS